MKKSILSAVIIFVGFWVFAIGAKAEGIKEGKWTMTMVTKMEGMGAEYSDAMKEMENMSPEEKAMMQKMMGGVQMNANGMGMTTTISQCLTNDNPVPEANTQDNCHETHSINGNTVTFEMVCDSGTSNGEVTYQNDSMNGTIHSQSTEGNVTINISGEYTGPCDAVKSVPAGKLSERELALKEKELELQGQQLELQRQQMELQASAHNQSASSKKVGLNDVNNAVNTGNKIKNTYSGLRSLMGN